MIPKPKFEIGQCVKKEFKGEIEGVHVTVNKLLWVWGVKAEYYTPPAPMSRGSTRYLYMLWESCPDFTQPRKPEGKEYRFYEDALIELEPVVGAVLTTQSQAVTDYAPASAVSGTSA